MKNANLINPDLDIPEGLSDLGKQAALIIIDFLKRKDMMYTGGCKAFHTPAEWRAHGEEYGNKSELIVCHDGGDLAPIFNFDYEQYELNEEMQKELRKAGMFAEQCTSYYAAIYKE